MTASASSGAARATTPAEPITAEELQLALRNHGMPLEALRYPLTPVGLHYLLTHYDIPSVDPATWMLEVDGHVRRPLRLSLEQIRARPSERMPVTMECAGNGRARLSPRPVSQPWLIEAVGTAEWTGTPLRQLLDEAAPLDGAADVVFTGLDHGIEGGVEQDYRRSLSVAEARAEGPLLAYEVNGQPLPPQHGFPLRLIVPGWFGMANVKWLGRITVLAEPFDGFQQTRAYRYRSSPDEPGTPVTRMPPRSLMVPPGFPDFLTRQRFLPPGPCRLEGRAWSGCAPIERVEVSTDGGHSWEAADLETQLGPHAWCGWSHAWHPAEPGVYELCCRASDAAGNQQPVEPRWNTGGYANNEVQRVTVVVGDPTATLP
jgi:DMSO/TMAO reductase YedYZ molybdopterin-dependent catalytic subunit